MVLSRGWYDDVLARRFVEPMRWVARTRVGFWVVMGEEEIGMRNNNE